MEKELMDVLNRMADIIANRIMEQVKQTSDSGKQEDFGMKLYTAKQVCEMLHISKSKLYRHKREGRLVPAKYTGRNSLFSQESIESYLNSFMYK